MKILIYNFFVIIIMFSGCSHSNLKNIPNYDRESNLDYQMESTSFDAEFKTLSTVSNETFRILFHNNSDTTKAILLLHGRGLYPNEPLVMDPLITNLRDDYNVVSIQLPVLEKGRTYLEYIDIFKFSDLRIKRTIEFMSNEYDQLIIIAHSCGAHMLSSYLKKYNARVDKIILIGAGAVDINQAPLPYYDFRMINSKILNIVGENDHNSVLQFSGIY